MGLPEYVRQAIDVNKYYFMLDQTLNWDRKSPKTSFISFKQGSRGLGTLIYNVETGQTDIQVEIGVVVEQNFLDYLVSALQSVGRDVWMTEIGGNMSYPEPLEELFRTGLNYTQ